jgi:uncharacterized membrane protein YdbT with pleckstrin-like domain
VTSAVLSSARTDFGGVQVLIYFLLPSLFPSAGFMLFLVPTLVAIVAYEALHHTLTLQADRVVIRHGFMGWKTSSAAYEQIETVSCRSDLIDRRLGIGVLKIQPKDGGVVKAKWIADPQRMVALIDERRRLATAVEPTQIS